MRFGLEEMKNGGKIINDLPNCSVGTVGDVWSKNKYPRSQFGIKYANQETNFLDYPEARKLSPDYIPVNVKYSFDEYGYRKYPSIFNNYKKTIFCFGCENTFGVGLSGEDTWPYILASLIGNVNVKNFGGIGHGSDSMVRTCYQIINSMEKFQYPDSIYFHFPDFFRVEYVGNIDKKIIQKSIQPLLYPTSSEIYIQNNLEDEFQYHHNENSKIYTYYTHTSGINSFFNFVDNFKFLEEFLEARNIKWYWYTWHKLMYELNKEELLMYLKNNTIMAEHGLKEIPQTKNMLSNDNVHFGRDYNLMLATEFLNISN